jgi:hypothetical protein
LWFSNETGFGLEVGSNDLLPMNQNLIQHNAKTMGIVDKKIPYTGAGAININNFFKRNGGGCFKRVIIRATAQTNDEINTVMIPTSKKITV